MKSRLLLGLLSGAYLATATIAHALPDNLLTKRRKALIQLEAAQNSPVTFKQKESWKSPLRRFTGDPNEELGRPIDPDYVPIEPYGSDREQRVNYYGSMMGFQAGMNSSFHTEATINNYLKGDLTLAYITMGLTEPAVAAGLSQAVNYIGNDVSNRLQGEQLYFSQLQYQPEVSQALGQLHINCISKAQSEQTMNWMAAQAYCSGDTANLTGTKGEFDGRSGGISQLSFRHDPNWSGGDANVILLSDYLFKRDAETSPGAAQLKEAFEQLIGNIEYRLDDATDSSAADRLGTRILNFKKIRPLADSFETIFREERAEVHSTLIALMTGVCGNTVTLDPNAPPRQNNPFFKQEAALQWVEKLSFNGFIFNTNLGQAIYSLTGAESSTTCPDFEGRYGLQAILDNPDNVGDVANEFAMLSYNIAMGRLYSIYILAEQYIRKLNVGAFDNFARKAAFELLYEAAGTDNIQKVYVENVVEFRKNLTNLADRVGKAKRVNQPKITDLAGGNEKSSPMGGDGGTASIS